MKNIAITLLFLIGISANSQIITVKGIQKYCETDRVDIRERFLSVTQNDSVIIESVKTKFGEFTFNVIKEGLYTLNYTTIFGQIVNQNIQVSKNTFPITVCVDQLQKTEEKTMFGEFKNQDKITIRFSSQGCFHSNNEKAIFYYEADKLIAELYIVDKLVSRKKLNPKSLEYLIEFEKKVMKMKNSMGGCTTSDSYSFSLNNKEKLSVNDSSCEWNGFNKLKKELFNYKS